MKQDNYEPPETDHPALDDDLLLACVEQHIKLFRKHVKEFNIDSPEKYKIITWLHERLITDYAEGLI